MPEANYKMIGALAVMKKQIEKSELADFVKQARNGGMGADSRSYSIWYSISWLRTKRYYGW